MQTSTTRTCNTSTTHTTDGVDVYVLINTSLYRGPDEETIGVYSTLKEMKDAFFSRLSYGSDPNYAAKAWDTMMKKSESSRSSTVEVEPNCFLSYKKMQVKAARTPEDVHCLTDICGFVSIHRDIETAHRRFISDFVDPPLLTESYVEEKWRTLIEKGVVEIKREYRIQRPSGYVDYVPAKNMYYNKAYLT